jgi:MoxR-like ATPase
MQDKVLTAVNIVAKGLLERETEVRLMLLAALCGEHLLLLGPPGTAKSELSRRLAGITRGSYFERLLTRFSVPEELFGPLSMRGLENDEYVRKLDGYLPTAEVAFIDEIFKANSAILNALLTLLNERLFDNGNERLPVPLLCLVGASNELPESEELDALYDRFLIRRQVAQVSSAQLSTLARIAAGGRLQEIVPGAEQAPAKAGELTMDDYRTTARRAVEAVDVPDSVIELLTGLRNYLQDKCEPPVYVSDRRFMKSINMLQVAAFADGRSQVSEYDLLLLEFVFGQRPDDAAKVKAHLLEAIASDTELQKAEILFLGSYGRACEFLSAGDAERLEETKATVASMRQLLETKHARLAATLDGNYPQLKHSVWQSEASQQSAVQTLMPQMTENKAKVEDLLRETMVMQEALQQDASAGLLEKLLPKRHKQYQRGISSRS